MNHSHNSTQMQTHLYMLRKHGVSNRQSWKSGCVEIHVSLLKAFSEVKEADISCKLMLPVAVIECIKHCLGNLAGERKTMGDVKLI